MTWTPLTQSDETRVTDPDTGGQKGEKLAQLGAIDPTSIMDVARVAGYGAQKYARYNFTLGYRWSLSYDALQRHLHAWQAGDNLDDESGLPHLAHAAWHCLTLLTFQRFDRGTDDRFPLRLDENGPFDVSRYADYHTDVNSDTFSCPVCDGRRTPPATHTPTDDDAYLASLHETAFSGATEVALGTVWPPTWRSDAWNATINDNIKITSTPQPKNVHWSEAEAATHFRAITDAWQNEHHAHHHTQPCTPGVCCAAEGETVETYGT